MFFEKSDLDVSHGNMKKLSFFHFDRREKNENKKFFRSHEQKKTTKL